MIVVYWLDLAAGGDGEARAQSFPSDALAAALRIAAELRARRKAGENISHVAILSELPESVGPAGVADPAHDYAHYKRRIDPAIPLGRPSGGGR